MGSGGGGSNTQTVQSADPWEGVQPYLLETYKKADELYSGPGPQMYGGSQIAPWNPQMQQGVANVGNLGATQQNAATNSAGTYLNTPQQLMEQYGQLASQAENVNRTLPQQLMEQYQSGANAAGANYQSMANTAADTWQSQMDPNNLDVANNEYVRNAAQAAINPIFQNLTEGVLPSIQMQGVGSGTLGGSRNDLAQAQAIERASSQAMDMTSRMYGQAYENEARRQMQATSMAPSMAQMQAIPWQMQMQAGQTGLQNLMAGEQAHRDTTIGAGQAGMQNLFEGQQGFSQALGFLGQQGAENQLNAANMLQGMDQAQLDEIVQRWNYEQTQPYDQLDRYLSLLSATPWGQTQNTWTPAAAGNPAMGAIGGGMAGYSAATALGASNPWGWAAMAAMAGLGMS